MNDRPGESLDDPPSPDQPEARDPVETGAAAFPVACIGSSAGGLEAGSELLAHMPAHPGLAVIVVAHLDPDHDSALAELLARRCAMPVLQLTGATTIAVDHVYVIGPGTGLTVRDGVVTPAPRSTANPHHPVDDLMVSLAADRGQGVIGVVLSGNGNDGTRGLEAIQEHGGLTLAQEIATAKYGGMPSAAIAHGVVDRVGPPDALAAHMLAFVGHPYTHPDSDHEDDTTETDEDAAALAEIFARLRARTGVDFRGYRASTLLRRIARRTALHGVRTLADYLGVLDRRADELDDLYDDLLIKVSELFREPDTFDALTDRVFPEMHEAKGPDDSLRVWVPGCATGEEPYSLAISLLQYQSAHGQHIPIQIYATDVSGRAIERARAGLFAVDIEDSLPAPILRRYFARVDGGYRVSKNVRDLCVFARQDLTRDPPFSHLDLISCRNVLIYLERSVQARILTMFHYALNPRGTLLLGHSETIGEAADLFALRDREHKLYLRKSATARPRLVTDPAPLALHADDQTTRRATRRWDESQLAREADQVVIDHYGPPGVVIDGDNRIVQFRGKTGRYLDPTPGEASLDVLKLIRPGLGLELRAAIHSARKQGQRIRREGLRLRDDHRERHIDVEVLPVGPTAGRSSYLLLLFDEHDDTPPSRDDDVETSPMEAQAARLLHQELEATQRALRAISEEYETANEELRAANEEIQSANEELQSTNEELQTAKEELQSTNEELTTLNDELESRNGELGQVNNDLSNLLASVEIPILILDNELRIRRFTPAAERALNLFAADIGRPLVQINLRVTLPALEPLLLEVLRTLVPQHADVRERDGRSYRLSVRPYRTADDRIEGLVLVFAYVGEFGTRDGGADG